MFPPELQYDVIRQKDSISYAILLIRVTGLWFQEKEGDVEDFFFMFHFLCECVCMCALSTSYFVLQQNKKNWATHAKMDKQQHIETKKLN